MVDSGLRRYKKSKCLSVGQLVVRLCKKVTEFQMVTKTYLKPPTYLPMRQLDSCDSSDRGDSSDSSDSRNQKTFFTKII